MRKPDISLFASAIKPHLWRPLLDSLKSNKLSYEVVFAGYIDAGLVKEVTDDYPELRYITTLDIKPAQCYEVASRACEGQYLIWISDDCEFSEGALDKIYRKMMSIQYSDILAIKTFDPECLNNNLDDNRFFPRNLNTPQMASVGCIARNYLRYLGGFDRRYIYGKFECDLCMRVLASSRGGRIIKYEEVEVKIDHTSKNWEYNNDWSGVNEDSETLENSWVVGGYKDFEKPIFCLNQSGIYPYYPISNREVTFNRSDKFEPYEDKDILEKSQSKNTRWL